MAENFIIQYPDTGDKGSITYGLSFFNFQEGTFINPAGTKTTLNRSLKNSNQDYIRSLAIFVSQKAKVKLGTGQAVKSELSNYGWNIFENLNIKELELETFTAGIPDTVQILIIGSTSSKSIYNPTDTIHHEQNVNTLASVNAAADILLKITDRFNHNTFILTEDGTNSITYTIQGKMTGPSAWVEIQGDTVLSANTDIIQVEGSWSMLKTTIKSTAAGVHGNVLAQWSGKG